MKRRPLVVLLGILGAVPLLVGFGFVFGVMTADVPHGAASGAPVFGAVVATGLVALLIAILCRRSAFANADRITAIQVLARTLLVFGLACFVVYVPFVGMDIALAGLDPSGAGLPRPGSLFVVGIVGFGLILLVVGVILGLIGFLLTKGQRVPPAPRV